MPFYSCENPALVRNVKHGSISYKTLLKYMRKLTKRVEEKTRNILTDKFGLVFDGWTAVDVHYVSMFATFPSENSQGYSKVLLCLSPFEDEFS